MNTNYRTCAEINLSSLSWNLKRIRTLAGNRKIIGVVKADAYGHGVREVTRRLYKDQVRSFAVANITEATAVNEVAPKAVVFLLSPLLPEEIPVMLEHVDTWQPTLSTLEEWRTLERAAALKKKSMAVHVKIDTGMGRLGSFASETRLILQVLSESRHLRLAGLFTHFASSDTDRKMTANQMRLLGDLHHNLIRMGIRVPLVHLPNSAGILRHKMPDYVGAVRPGLSLYGIPNPASSWKRKFGPKPLKPVLSWKVRVALVRDMPKGTTVGYQSTYRTSKRIRMAVVSAGYADGIFRKLSNRGQILVHGVRCPILGRVTMDMTMLDVSAVPQTQWGDEAVILGKSGKDEITAAEFAAWAETSPYETICHVGKRVPRVTVT